MVLQGLINNILHPPVLFFFLGLFAAIIKSDLDIPPQVGKFLSIYLLFDIGIKGGEELLHSGYSIIVFKTMVACALLSLTIPFIVYKVLRFKLDIYNSGAIASTYGSVSAVTFASGMAFLNEMHISFGGHMIAGMALMESPAIISGLILIGLAEKYRQTTVQDERPIRNKKTIFKEAFFNGSVLLLMGSLIIGMLSGSGGEEDLKPFVNDIFIGMLSLYMLDMGILSGKRLEALKASGSYLVCFSLFYPIIFCGLGMAVSAYIGLGKGDALLMTILTASASYIAVPAAMRLAVPQTNLSLLLPMSLGVTFSFNVTIGIPIYFMIISNFWGT